MFGDLGNTADVPNRYSPTWPHCTPTRKSQLHAIGYYIWQSRVVLSEYHFRWQNYPPVPYMYWIEINPYLRIFLLPSSCPAVSLYAVTKPSRPPTSMAAALCKWQHEQKQKQRQAALVIIFECITTFRTQQKADYPHLFLSSKCTWQDTLKFNAKQQHMQKVIGPHCTFASDISQEIDCTHSHATMIFTKRLQGDVHWS